jgi:hypothetical protein
LVEHFEPGIFVGEEDILFILGEKMQGEDSGIEFSNVVEEHED